MKYFCTYFDKNFIYQGLALYESLLEHAGEFSLWILCFDDKTFQLIKALNKKEILPISFQEFESANLQLFNVKENRSLVEYYWTATPFLPLYILENYPSVDTITYLDADLFFFDSLEPIYLEWGDGSIYLVPHRFAPETRESGEREAGLYNVGFVGFKNDFTGVSALKRWTEQNLEWCYDRIEPGRMGDQAYLHDWAERFSGVVITQNIGVGAGGWNVMNYRFKKMDDKITINERSLIMLHLNFIHLISKGSLIGIPRRALRIIYLKYAKVLTKVREMIDSVDTGFSFNYSRISKLYIFYCWVRCGFAKY